MVKKLPWLKIFAGLLIFSATIGGGFFIFHAKARKTTAVPKDEYVAFLSEVYDVIKTNYWDKITDEQLINIFVLGTEKLSGKPQIDKPKDKAGLYEMIAAVLNEAGDEQKKKDYTVQLADIALANLQPFGRSRLYSQKQEVDLKNRVENINPQINQYDILETNKEATTEELKKAFEEKSSELKKDTSPEAKDKLAQVSKAFEILSDEKNRQIYDQSGVEPTMEYKLLRPDIFYIHLNKFSPTTIEELVRVTGKVDKGESLNILIFDLRDNVGGAIDGLPYFLGPFIGIDQYAFQFYHQGEKEDFKTKIGWLPSLVRYKKVIVLINDQTQSSAEVMAATIKKYNVGILVGTTTKGWGTVERVFEIEKQINPEEKYSVFLVHRLTLREDGQPIEGRGVEPVININSPDWQKQLYAYFHYPELAQAIKEVTGWK